MLGTLRLLALGREDLTVAALAVLVVAGAIVAVGAWLLFFREARRTRASGSPEGEERVAGSAEAEVPRMPEPAEVAETGREDAES